MSTFDEQKYAIEKTKTFLFDLLDPKKTPRIPKEIRKRASYCLKHYPLVLDMFLEEYILNKQENE